MSPHAWITMRVRLGSEMTLRFEADGTVKMLRSEPPDLTIDIDRIRMEPITHIARPGEESTEP
jgi:hypothetical protein